MSRNLLDLTFAVKRVDEFESGIWRLWITRHGDVYLAQRTMAGITKYSFHRSGICWSAFTAQHGVPPTLNDRAMSKWHRLATQVQGVGKASRVAWIAIPTDFLSRPKTSVPLSIVWLEAAPSGGATYIEVAFTAEAKNCVENSFLSNGRRLVAFCPLPGGDSLLVNYYHADWVNEDLKMPGDGKVADLLFSAHDPNDTGRPIRITFGPAPKDGDALVVRELGGYAV